MKVDNLHPCKLYTSLRLARNRGSGPIQANANAVESESRS